MRGLTRPDSRRPATDPSVEPASDAERPARETQLDWLVGGLVLVGCAIGQLALLQGPHPHDPAKYFQTAVDFPNVPVDYWTLRIGLIAPVRVAVLLFGPSQAALYGVPLAMSLLLAGSVYATMLVLFRNRIAAAAAALVTVLNASYLLNSGYIFPDTAATATFAAGFLCLVLGRRRPGGEDEGWAPTVAVLCAGVLFGWTYLIRELSPVLLPAVIAAVWLLRYPWRRIALLAGAAVATASLELLYGVLRYGDPLEHARTLLDRREAAIRPARRSLMERIQEQLNDPLDTILVFPRLLLTWNTGWIFILLLAVFVVALVRFRDRRLWLLAAWCFSFWAVMAVFGLWRVPSGELIVNVTNIRYWYPIFPPLVMGAFGGLTLLLQEYVSIRRGGLVTATVTAAVAGLALVPGTVEFSRCAAKDVWRNDPAERWDELRAWLGSDEAQRYDVLRTDRFTHKLVPAYTSRTFGGRVWDGEVQRLGPPRLLVTPDPSLRSSLVLVHKPRFFAAIPNPQQRLNGLRRLWSPTFVSEDGNMVVLAYDPVTPAEAAARDTSWTSPPTSRGEAVDGECGLSPYDGS